MIKSHQLRLKPNRYSLMLFFSFLLFACNNQIQNHEKFIKNLSNDSDYTLPFHNESLMIFVETRDGISIFRLRELYTIYKKDYEGVFIDFDRFLISVINKNLLSEKIMGKNNFTIDGNVESEFQKKGINYLMQQYCEQSTDNRKKFYLKRIPDVNIKYSVLYYAFKQNYYIMQNDYSGKYVLIDKN